MSIEQVVVELYENGVLIGTEVRERVAPVPSEAETLRGEVLSLRTQMRDILTKIEAKAATIVPEAVTDPATRGELKKVKDNLTDLLPPEATDAPAG